MSPNASMSSICFEMTCRTVSDSVYSDQASAKTHIDAESGQCLNAFLFLEIDYFALLLSGLTLARSSGFLEWIDPGGLYTLMAEPPRTRTRGDSVLGLVGWVSKRSGKKLKLTIVNRFSHDAHSSIVPAGGGPALADTVDGFVYSSSSSSSLSLILTPFLRALAFAFALSLASAALVSLRFLPAGAASSSSDASRSSESFPFARWK